MWSCVFPAFEGGVIGLGCGCGSACTQCLSPSSILEVQLLRATSSPGPSASTSLTPGGRVRPQHDSIPFYLPQREYHSICLYWSTPDCRQYQNSGFGTANNQQQHQLKTHEKHFILMFLHFSLCQFLTKTLSRVQTLESNVILTS